MRHKKGILAFGLLTCMYCFTSAGTSGSKLQYHQLDISSAASVAAFADWLKQQHGKLDILVNNAGDWQTAVINLDAGYPDCMETRTFAAAAAGIAYNNTMHLLLVMMPPPSLSTKR
jgi:NAD(P)-dependent dehydrogenase (short-subunit alcohol dehydrogenase family)